MKRIFIIDDHKMFIEGITSMLKNTQQFEVIGYALSAEDFLRRKQYYQYDILILDIHLPQMNGIELAKRMRNEQPELKIIILSMADSPSLIAQLKKLKINGFLTKNASLKDVINSLSQVVSNKTSFPTQVITNQKAIIQDTHYLTRREIEVVQQISNGSSSRQIADNLFISKLTVETHRKNITQKLGSKNVAQLIRFATKEGIL